MPSKTKATIFIVDIISSLFYSIFKGNVAVSLTINLSAAVTFGHSHVTFIFLKFLQRISFLERNAFEYAVRITAHIQLVNYYC